MFGPDTSNSGMHSLCLRLERFRSGECSKDGASDRNQSDPRAVSRQAKVFTLREWRVYTGDLFSYCIDLKLLATCINCW
jgi:hypothetical protein